MNRILSNRCLFKYIAGSLLICFFLSDASAAVLEEVVVTAQKREQNIQDVGISITAFSGEQLKQLGISNTRDLDMHTPGLMVTDGGGGTTTVFTVRGSAQLDFADHQEPPVAVYSDGAYNSYLGGVGFNFYDIERIEVLRGPQGTLFGRNATGGLVHLIAKKPTREREGYAEFTAGDFEKIKFEGALSGPLSETVAARLSILIDTDDGFIENRIGKNLNNTNSKSGRIQFLFEPNDDLSVLLNVRMGIDDSRGQGYNIRRAGFDDGFGVVFADIPGVPSDALIRELGPLQHAAFCGGFFGPPFPLAVGPTDCFAFTEPDDGPHTIAIDEIGFFEREHYGVSATFEWDINENMQLVSITDWQEINKDYLEDTDGTPAPLFNFPQQFDSNQISQELRLQGDFDLYRWVAGFYYLNIDSDFRSGVDIENCCLLTLDNTFSLETDSYAFFVQGEYDLTSNWTVIAGLRWTEDEKDYQNQTGCINIDVPFELLGLPAPPCDLFFGGTLQNNVLVNASRSEGEWSGLFEIDWKPNDDWLVYGKITRGNKAGGFNGGASLIMTLDELEFQGEILTSYEGGFKTSLFDGKARLNASVFYYDYEDFQTFFQQGVSLRIFNVDAKNKGAEIELFASPWEGWDFLAGVSIQSAEQQDILFGGITRNRPMPNAPDITFNGMGRYEWPMFGGTMAAQMDFNYVDERSLSSIDHPALVIESYLVANAKLSYTTADGRWQAELWVNNFTDEEYVASAFDITTFTGVVIDAFAPPRWFGATIRHNW